MMPVLEERDIEPLLRSEQLAFVVRKWDQISWTGSAGPRHRAFFEDAAVLDRQPTWGVIAQFRTPDGVIMPMLLVWQRESADGSPSWKLVTILPIQTQ